MNLSQKKYTQTRIDVIKAIKLNNIKASCPLKKGLSDSEKMSLIYEDKVSLKPHLPDFYDFSALEPDNSEIVADMDARIKTLDAETQRLKDVVMLGNAEEALSMIQEFVEKEF